MTRDDDTERNETDEAGTSAELRRALAAHLKGRPIPPDLVITTRTEIERREFTAYGQGWRDRGEHDERRRAEAADRHRPRPGTPADATVLPFPPLSGPQPARPHPDTERP
ncbi:hypothetical protein ACWDR3_32055 [Streptomyces sp. NPDC001002]